jgi:hypothetical protein
VSRLRLEGVPDIPAREAWKGVVDVNKARDQDDFRLALKAYARATIDTFRFVQVEQALREDKCLPCCPGARGQEALDDH